MSHRFDSMEFCPICKENTPHDSRSGFDACKVCGIVRMQDCTGAFKKCEKCDEFIPDKPSAAIDLEKEELIVIPPPAHVCKGAPNG